MQNMSAHTIYKYHILLLSISCLLFSLIWSCADRQQAIYNAAKASSYFERGKQFEEQGITDSAVYYYRACHSLVESNDTSSLRMQVSVQMGSLLFFNGYIDRSIKCYKESNQIARQLNDSNYSSFTYRKIGISHFFKNNYDSALYFLQEAYHYIRPTEDEEETASLYNNLSGVYAETGDYDKAMNWNSKAIAKCTTAKALGHNYAQRSNIFLKLNKLDSAAHYSYLCINDPDPYTRVSSLETLYIIHSMQGSADSIQYYTQLSNLTDSLWRANKAVEIAEIEFSLEQQRAQQMSDDSKHIYYFLAIVAAVAGILMFFRIRMLKKQQCASGTPAADNTSGTEENDAKTNGSTDIHFTNEMLIKKGDMLAEVFTNSLAYKKYAPRIATGHSFNFQDQTDFFGALEQTFESFQTDLTDLCKLTREESILCCLYLIGFSNHECATCKNVSDNAIRTQKSRIKAKMTPDDQYLMLFEHICKKNK